ncbi:MAG: Na+/H+ antiporter [Sphingomonas sp.]
MVILEVLLGLLALCLVLALVARRLNVPVAVMLVLGGIGVGFLPGLPEIELEPELALALFLPPLLQLSGYRTDWPAFRSKLRPILLLAFGAVVFTAAAVAVVVHWLVPALPWGAALALGAIVAPPDAVAAGAVLRDLKPPKHIVTVLEGESLLNDASSLVLYRFAVAATMAGSFEWGEGLLSFFLSAIGGTLIGLVIGRIAMWIFARLDDTLHDITVSVLAGFAAYFAAEYVHVSGVLGVVGCGMVLGRHQYGAFSARTRLESAAVWNFIEFVLTSLVFMLIGMQLPSIVERLAAYDIIQLEVLAAAIAGTVIVSRFLWVMPMAWVPRLLSRRVRAKDPLPPARELTILSWAGMRGVVSMAAALALPLQFPARDLIVFLAFCAIFATLVLQGTTLGPLIRRLGVTADDGPGPHPDKLTARVHVAEAALSAVEDRLDDPDKAEAANELVGEFRDRVDRVAHAHDTGGEDLDQARSRLHLRLDAIAAAREALLSNREEYEDEAGRALTAELDLEEEQIRTKLGQR